VGFGVEGGSKADLAVAAVGLELAAVVATLLQGLQTRLTKIVESGAARPVSRTAIGARAYKLPPKPT